VAQAYMLEEGDRLEELGPGLPMHRDPISKISNTRRAGGLAQVVENLPTKCKALS
jgi:hypothetical protein